MPNQHAAWRGMPCEAISTRLSSKGLGRSKPTKRRTHPRKIASLQNNELTAEYFLVIQAFVDYSVRLAVLIFRNTVVNEIY
jgi:hypothetical protein